MIKIAQKEIDISFINFNENIAYLIHTMRCNLNCSYCYNKRNLEKVERNDINSYLKILKRHKSENPGINHICISGGEPLIESIDDVILLLKELRKLDLNIKLDTNGTYPNNLSLLLAFGSFSDTYSLLDYVAMDIKWNLFDDHSCLNEKILKSLKSLLVKKNMDPSFEFELRTTLCYPLFNDYEDFILCVKCVDDMIGRISRHEEKIVWNIQSLVIDENIFNSKVKHEHIIKNTQDYPEFNNIVLKDT